MFNYHFNCFVMALLVFNTLTGCTENNAIFTHLSCIFSRWLFMTPIWYLILLSYRFSNNFWLLTFLNIVFAIDSQLRNSTTSRIRTVFLKKCVKLGQNILTCFRIAKEFLPISTMCAVNNDWCWESNMKQPFLVSDLMNYWLEIHVKMSMHWRVTNYFVSFCFVSVQQTESVCGQLIFSLNYCLLCTCNTTHSVKPY